MFNWLKKLSNKSANSLTTYGNMSEIVSIIGKNRIDINSQQLAMAYKGHVYACVNFNTNAVAKTELKLIAMTSVSQNKSLWPAKKTMKRKYKHDASLKNNVNFKSALMIEEIESHPFITLLETPNPKDTTYSFMSKIMINLELFGSAYILLNKVGDIPIQMDVLHSQFVTPDIDVANSVVRGYLYCGFGSKSLYYAPEQIAVIQYYNPRSDFDGQSPLESAWADNLLDNSYTEHAIAINENGGIPSGIFKYLGKSLTEKERDILNTQYEKRFKSVSNAGRNMVIGNDIEWIPLGLSNQDMQWMEGKKHCMKKIAEAYGIPILYLDTELATNKAVIDGAKYIYESNHILPKLRNIVDSINNQIVSLYGEDRIYLSYDNPVAQDRIDLIAETTQLLASGIYTVEEAKMLIGE